jgi:DNA-binding LacI/PurR family transcriptional regulator
MPQPQIKQATLRDIADKVGVSYQTVWRVVNDHPNVAKATRSRVQRAVEELDYRPHRAAQMLTTGRLYILQLVIFEYGHSDRLPAILHWAREYGYSIMVTELGGPPAVASVRSVLRETSQMIDGLLFLMPYPHLSYDDLSDLCQGRPFVVVNTKLGSKMPSVVFDQWNGARSAVNHLIDLGHREIAEISGPLDHFDAAMRHRAWEVFLGNNGLEPSLTVVGDFSVRSGYICAKEILAQTRPFTALFVGNDTMALGALRALHEAGLRVPQDVSVVGFDDIATAAYFGPPLTTMRQDFEALGRESIEYLVSRIGSPDASIQQRVLYPELVIRKSTQQNPV